MIEFDCVLIVAVTGFHCQELTVVASKGDSHFAKACVHERVPDVIIPSFVKPNTLWLCHDLEWDGDSSRIDCQWKQLSFPKEFLEFKPKETKK